MNLVTGYHGENHVTASQWADLNRGIIGNASLLPVGNQMNVEIQTANLITVSDGIVMYDGREFYIGYGETVDIPITSGTQGMLRHDIVVVQYSKDQSSGIESAEFVVIEGTPAASNPQDPAYDDQDIRTGVFSSQKPFCKVVINNTAIQEIQMLVNVSVDINGVLKNSGGTLTGNLTIHKNDPYLRLKNAQGGDQELGLHYYGTVAGENLFGIYDVTGQTHLMTISQETKEVKFYGTLQAIAENNYGKVYAGDKIYMSTDAEGGNLRITPPNGNGNFWEMDAYNGNLRFYHYDATQGKITAQFNWGARGTVSAPFVLNALTATVAGYVLDARQGKALNDKITALQTPSMGNGTKANSNILSEGFNCHYTKIGRLVQLSIEFDTGTNTISNQKQKLATGVPIPAYPEQSLGIMHCAYANYSPVSINVTSDGVYTWYCGDLVANASYRGFVVYIANS